MVYYANGGFNWTDVYTMPIKFREFYFRELLKTNIRLAISSRGLGSVKDLNDGTVMVQEDFELVGWDFVSNPSTHGAFMAPMNESKHWKQVADECGKWCKSQDLMREIIIELN